MSRMRMQDEFVEIDSTALRFDVAESEYFLVERGGLDLDHTDVEELTVRTDGWVAALQLASLSLRDRDDPVELIGTMTSGRLDLPSFSTRPSMPWYRNGFDIDTTEQNIRSGPPAPPFRVAELCRPHGQTY